MATNKIRVLFILLLFSNLTFGQNYIDLVKFDYTITPPNPFDSGGVSTRMQEINGDFTAPIKINDDYTFLTGITYEMTTASFNPGRAAESITGLTLKLGANITLNDQWSATYLLLPKLSSDFKNVSAQDFQLGSAVLMKYTKNDHFNYKFGIYGNGELFGPFLVPIFGFYYLNPAENFELKALLPLSVAMDYSFTKNLSLGLTYRGQIRSYNLNTPIGAEAHRYLARSTNEAYLYFQYKTEKGFHFRLNGGHSIGRSYRIYNEKIPFSMPLFYFGDNRTQLNTDFADGWLFKIAAFYRFKLPTK